jgi:hypothetical protein
MSETLKRAIDRTQSTIQEVSGFVKVDVFSNPVAVYEVLELFVDARNKKDASLAIERMLKEGDKIEFIKGIAGGYSAKVRTLRLRDG